VVSDREFADGESIEPDTVHGLFVFLSLVTSHQEASGGNQNDLRTHDVVIQVVYELFYRFSRFVARLDFRLPWKNSDEAQSAAAVFPAKAEIQIL
jgi:hypothetical protein